MVDIILEIDSDGDVQCLYTDEINLYDIGRIVSVQKASNVEFDAIKQMWDVTTLDGDIVYSNKNREEAIRWEIINFSPGGSYYENIKQI